MIEDQDKKDFAMEIIADIIDMMFDQNNVDEQDLN